MDIWSILIIAAIGIISTVNNSNKKKNEARKKERAFAESNEDANPEEQPVSRQMEYRPLLEEMEELNRKPWSYDDEYLTKGGGERNYFAEEEEDQVADNNAAMASVDSEELTEAINDDITSNFNLRDAVICSELLKPKFND